ncbi:30S ribosome-binding factor RbfA [Candidatus Gracilibacteria bacterium]|nr:30S ribosome-binding factor RbfA [Candidatus Gracilibacteria bacterium]
MSLRNTRMESTILREVREYVLLHFQEYESETGIISITEVKLTPDKSHLSVFVAYDSDKYHDIMRKLKSLIPELRRHLSKKLALRSTPKITFKPAGEKKSAVDITSLIKELDEKYKLSQ